ncbi:MAG TPA: TetR/AcrR family transcriptional regulator [bacterium]
MTHLSHSRRTARTLGERGQRTRQRLLDAAEAAFGQRGYFASSIVDVTRRARVAQGTFYIYFPSKRAIFTELVRQRSRDVRQTIQEAVRGLRDRAKIERAGFRAFFRFIDRHRNMYRIVRQAEFVDPAVFRWYYRHFAEGYITGLREAQRAGQVREIDPEVLAFCLMGIGDFVGMRWVLWERGGPGPDVVDAMMEFILQGLAADGARPFDIAAPAGRVRATGGARATSRARLADRVRPDGLPEASP